MVVYTGAYTRAGRKRGSRRLVVKWEDAETGRRGERSKTVAVAGKREAQRLAEEWMAELRAAEGEGERRRRSGADRTVAEYVRDYIDSREAEGSIEASTVHDYRRSYRDVADPDGGIADLPLADLGPDDVRAWEVRLSDPARRGLAPVTVRKRHTLLKQALKQAVSDRVIPHSPMEGVRGPKVSSKRPNALTEESMARLTAIMAVSDPTPLMAACGLALWAGMRREEIVALKWSDVHLDERYVFVHAAHGVVRGTTYEKDTKTHRDRQVPILPQLDRLLRARLDEIEGKLEDLGMFAERADSLYVCGDVDGGPWSIHMATKAFRVLADSVGLKGTSEPTVSLYDLRHSFATYAMSSHDGEPGLDAVLVAEIMGNSPSVVERWYATAVPERVIAAGPALARKFLPDGAGDAEYSVPE